MKLKDVREGVKIGILTAIRPWGCGKRGNKRWLFKCDCGNYKPIQVSYLTKKSSCGCRITNKTHGDNAPNSKYRRLYFCWHDMKNRCYNKNSKKYHRYGERGIKVYDKWRNDYSTFKKWALNSGWDYNLSQQDQSLDRIDVNGNYEPDNCRWTDLKTQNRNKENSIYVEFRGENVSLSELQERYKIPPSTIRNRYYAGKRGEDLIAPSKPSYKRGKEYLLFGKMMTVREISIKCGISPYIIRKRVKENTLNELERKKRK